MSTMNSIVDRELNRLLDEEAAAAVDAERMRQDTRDAALEAVTESFTTRQNPVRRWFPQVKWRLVDARADESAKTMVMAPADPDEPPLHFVVTRTVPNWKAYQADGADQWAVRLLSPWRVQGWYEKEGFSADRMLETADQPMSGGVEVPLEGRLWARVVNDTLGQLHALILRDAVGLAGGPEKPERPQTVTHLPADGKITLESGDTLPVPVTVNPDSADPAE